VRSADASSRSLNGERQPTANAVGRAGARPLIFRCRQKKPGSLYASAWPGPAPPVTRGYPTGSAGPRTEDACACPEDAGARHAVPLRPPMPPPRLPLRLGFAFWPGAVVARPLAGPPRFGFLPGPERLAVPPLAGLRIFRLTATLQEVSCPCPIPPDAIPPGPPRRAARSLCAPWLASVSADRRNDSGSSPHRGGARVRMLELA